MNYYIKFIYNGYDYKRFAYIKDEDRKSIISYDVGLQIWIMSCITTKNYYKSIPDLSLLPEEEYFQESLVWEYSFPIEIALKIMTVAKSEEYNFSEVKSVLLKEGIIE